MAQTRVVLSDGRTFRSITDFALAIGAKSYHVVRGQLKDGKSPDALAAFYENKLVTPKPQHAAPASVDLTTRNAGELVIAHNTPMATRLNADAHCIFIDREIYVVNTAAKDRIKAYLFWLK
jgi:hypothetical protein